MLLRIAEAENRPCREKVMAPKNELGVKKSERMLLTLAPPDGVNQGEWATDCREAFEKELRKYIGGEFPRSPDGTANGAEE